MTRTQGKFRLRPLAPSALVIGLVLGCGCASLPSPAHGAGATPALQGMQDCFAVGDVSAREACFAKMPDDEIADCERRRANACMPYKEMHALEQQRTQLGQQILAKSRQAYASYVEDDAAYLDDLAAYMKTSDTAWVAYRDADCALEPFAQGMSRREAPDLTEACRVERTQARIEQLKALAAELK